jgi:hypothetical protein
MTNGQVVQEKRIHRTNRGLICFATGEYNQYIPSLIASAQEHFTCHFYLFTDKPENYKNYKDVTVIYIDHIGWPATPLLRWAMLYKSRDIFQEVYLYMIDSEARFMSNIGNSVLDHRVAVLHRNIMRFREEFNYERRRESTAYIEPDKGERYYACGFVGGKRSEVFRMADVMSTNIKADIERGIRARWGDESHLNRYFVDNRPTLVLPPNYMCPSKNPYFIPYIMHRDKDFKAISKEDTDKYLIVNPKDFEGLWQL